MQQPFRPKDPLREGSQFVKGVGPSRQKLLSRLGIETVEDLVSHFPRAYYDRSNLLPIGDIGPGADATFLATTLAVSLRTARRGQSILTVAVGDETGIVHLTFFNQPYLEKQFKQGTRIIATGRMRYYKGQKQIVAPDYELLSGELDESLIHTGRIVPVYPLTAGISQRMMRRIIKSALEKTMESIAENLPARVLASKDFPSRGRAFVEIHYPESWESLKRAVRRFKFEEVFFLHLLIKDRRIRVLGGRPRPDLSGPHPLLERFLESLPFELTAAQERVLGEIRSDVGRENGLGRLVQGDVGSGKTVIGVAAMMMAIGKGFQAAMMVPTEILAQQHFEKISRYLEGLSVSVELLIGSMSGREKGRVHEALREGSVDLVIGTHALIQEGIAFHQLGLAVIDEQHRFGVRQRAKLGDSGLLPHFIVMTATPIPRSLAQTVYGDLDLSIIDELPFGRRNVRTEIVEAEERDRVYAEVRDILHAGRQAFFLYPLIEESEKSDLLAATEAFERFQADEFGRFPIGLLHGRMSFEEKSKVVQMFRNGEIGVLVTTTVIEVGVDIPNASVLVVNNPERFGLAQLHQLRGRVGRRGSGGVCYLILGESSHHVASARLRLFAETDDGFRLAEEDLRLRGPGEIWGFRQSGMPAFRLINPVSDSDIVQQSWRETDRLLKTDPGLNYSENKVVSDYFRMYYKPRMAVADIG